MSDDIFSNMEGDFDDVAIALAEAAKFLVPFFKAFMAQGLSVQEAAALTAAIMAQSMPFPAKGPQEGS